VEVKALQGKRDHSLADLETAAREKSRDVENEGNSEKIPHSHNPDKQPRQE
jgi:hypothetical protein